MFPSVVVSHCRYNKNPKFWACHHSRIMLLSQLFHTKCRFLTYREGKVPVHGAGLGTDESHGAPHVVFASSEGPQVRVCTEDWLLSQDGTGTVTTVHSCCPSWSSNCYCPETLFLPWKRQPKEGSMCACVKVIRSHLNVEVFVLAW